MTWVALTDKGRPLQLVILNAWKKERLWNCSACLNPSPVLRPFFVARAMSKWKRTLCRGFVQKIRTRMIRMQTVRCDTRLQVHFVQDLFPTDLGGLHHRAICFVEPQAWQESDAWGRHCDVFMSCLQLHLLHVQAHYQCLGLHVSSQSTFSFFDKADAPGFSQMLEWGNKIGHLASGLCQFFFEKDWKVTSCVQLPLQPLVVCLVSCWTTRPIQQTLQRLGQQGDQKCPAWHCWQCESRQYNA